MAPLLKLAFASSKPRSQSTDKHWTACAHCRHAQSSRQTSPLAEKLSRLSQRLPEHAAYLESLVDRLLEDAD